MRDEIVIAATRLLDGGTEQVVTLRAVAREAGISAPSIYPHFADRDAILLAVTQAAFAELEDELGAIAVQPDPVDHVRAVCAAYLLFAQRFPNRYRIMFGGVWDASKTLGRVPALAEELAILGVWSFGVLRQAVADCIAVGRTAGTDAQSDATALWVGLHGFAQLQVATPLFPWPPELQTVIINRLALLPDQAS